MTKIITILIIAAIIESIGVALLARGLKEVKGAKEITVSEIARVLKSGATNGNILVGIAFEAGFFGCLLYMMSVRDMSFIWPLTSIGFIVTTLAAQFLLKEKVDAWRWAGVVLIALGACLSSYSEALKQQKLPEAPPQHSTSLGPQ
ncbi:MAG TPA: EamA family transporter [Verrucomicrobiae bacterium]|jgi:drug/metabolite transporter (DMT)-like permease|nr:EamA family transporter [Verrucomicrobiae bacterium]